MANTSWCAEGEMEGHPGMPESTKQRQAASDSVLMASPVKLVVMVGFHHRYAQRNMSCSTAHYPEQAACLKGYFTRY